MIEAPPSLSRIALVEMLERYIECLLLPSNAAPLMMLLLMPL